MTIFDPGDQAHRRQVMKDDALARHPSQQPPAPTTYHQLAQRPRADQAKPDAGPLHYPAQPASSPWSGDPTGIEPPLGVAIDEMEPTGTAAEVAKSLRERGS